MGFCIFCRHSPQKINKIPKRIVMPLARDIYYAESITGDPSRPPVVLVHGAGSDHRIWPMEIRRLNGWRVLAVDLPGHGRSGGRSRQSVAAYADDLANFLDDLKIYRAIVVGHALGAAVALQLAVEQPDLLAGLGLASASTHFSIPPILVEYFSNPLTLALGIQLFQQWAFSPQTNPAQIEAWLEPVRSTRPATLAGDWQAYERFDLQSDLEQISAPTWVVTGGDDRMAPLPCAHYLSTRLPEARLQIVPGAGHMLPFEQPAALQAGLSGFLARLSAQEYVSKVRVAAQVC
jgi:pimeloyl-ACP methyl ester carboxylesterase